MKQIPLTKGKVTVVDDADYEELSRYKWHVAAEKYPARWGRRGERHIVYMHRQIMQPPDGMEVDHIDGNTFNNLRSNLRVCTHAENIHNAKRPSNNKSGVKGVYFNKDIGKWSAAIANALHLRLYYSVKLESEKSQ